MDPSVGMHRRTSLKRRSTISRRINFLPNYVDTMVAVINCLHPSDRLALVHFTRWSLVSHVFATISSSRSCRDLMNCE